MRRRVSVVKDIPVVNRFQGVVFFFFLGVFQGTLTSDREGKLKEILLFFFFLAFHLLSLPRAAVWSQPLESSPVGGGRKTKTRKKKKESVCSHQLLTSLLFRRLVRALSNQSPAELDFHLSTPAFISTSLSFTIPLSCLFFLGRVITCLYCKLN